MAQDGVRGPRPSRVTEWARRGGCGSRATDGQPRRARFFAPHTKKNQRDSRGRVTAIGRVERMAGTSDKAMDTSAQSGGENGPVMQAKRRTRETNRWGANGKQRGDRRTSSSCRCRPSRSCRTSHLQLPRPGRRATRDSPCRVHARRSSTSNAQHPSWRSAIAPLFQPSSPSSYSRGSVRPSPRGPWCRSAPANGDAVAPTGGKGAHPAAKAATPQPSASPGHRGPETVPRGLLHHGDAASR